MVTFIIKMDAFQDVVDIENTKTVRLQPLYNTDQTLEFQIQPEKSHLLFSDILLHIDVKVPASFVPDNGFMSKLFDSIEVKLNGETITNRSNANEYFLTEFLLSRVKYDVNNIKTNLGTRGYFSIQNMDNYGFLSQDAEAVKISKQIIAQRTMLEIKQGNTLTHRMYRLIGPLCTPLAHAMKPLPTNMSVSVSLKRSQWQIPLLAIDATNSYPTTNINLENCFLEVPFVTSNSIDQRYGFSLTSTLQYNLDEYHIRNSTIVANTNETQFALSPGGNLPRILICGLLDPAGFRGDITKSATRFSTNELSSFELLIDNETLPQTPINCKRYINTEAYVQFLRVTKWFNNAYAARTLSQEEFELSNLILCYDFQIIEQEKGWLQFKLKFDQPTSAKLMFVALFIYEKTVEIDRERNVDIL